MERNSATAIGIVIGTALGFAVIFKGFTGFIVVAVFAAVGVLVGRVIDGQLDLTGYLGGRNRRDR